MNTLNQIWPNFFIVGAGKSGTTSVHEHLRKHPHVFLPEMKEPHFFSAVPPPAEVPSDTVQCSNLRDYLNLYKDAAGFRAIGDASTSYLSDIDAPRRIHEVASNAKIIIILRDPIARAHSEYLMNVRRKSEIGRTFLEALRNEQKRTKSWWSAPSYIGRGLYYAQVQRYIEMFGQERVLVLLFDDLNKAPDTFLGQVCAHIGIDPALLVTEDLEHVHNPWRAPRFGVVGFAERLQLRKAIPGPLRKAIRSWVIPVLFETKKPPVDPESKELLRNIFEPDIVKLESLLGRQFPQLRRSWNHEAPSGAPS